MRKTVADLFAFAVERESIRLRRESGQRAPWTTDPVLQHFRFCNVYREDDRTTVWFRENIREPLRDSVKVALATIIFRWFNRISTGQLIRDELVIGTCSDINIDAVESILRPVQARGKQLFTGAFIIKSPNGFDKLTGILDCCRTAREELQNRPDDAFRSMESAHGFLVDRVPYLGQFMAYQVVVDLRFTAELENAPDLLSWAAAGPGSARGLAWLRGGEPLAYGSAAGQRAMVAEMRELMWTLRARWPSSWRAPEMADVQNLLCEADKYWRGHAGERLKRRFDAGRGE